MSEVAPPAVVEPQPVDEVRRTKNARLAKQCVIGMYVLAAAWGAAQVYLPEPNKLLSAVSIGFAILATLWFQYDARSHGKKILPVVLLLYFLAWPLGATIYLIGRSGLRGAWLAVMHGVGLAFVCFIVANVIIYGLHYSGSLDERFYQE